MVDNITIGIAVWGAVLSTALAGLEVIRQLTDRPRLRIDLRIGVLTDHGFLAGGDLGDDRAWGQLDRAAAEGGKWALCINVTNRGRRPTNVQVVSLQTPEGDNVENPRYLPGSTHKGRLPVRLDENEGLLVFLDAEATLVPLHNRGISLTRVRCEDMVGNDASVALPYGMDALMERLLRAAPPD